MPRTPHRKAAVALVVMVSACSRTEAPPRFAPPTDVRSEAEPAEVELEEVSLPADIASSDDIAAADTSAVMPSGVDAEVCRQACDNALAVTLAELPESAAPSMRDELTRALREECPSRCIARSSLESARCIAGAKSALALAACP